jgi:hypothetical protein
VIEKFHNTVNFTRRTPQRREAFLEIYGCGIIPDIEGKRCPEISIFLLRLRLILNIIGRFRVLKELVEL